MLEIGILNQNFRGPGHQHSSSLVGASVEEFTVLNEEIVLREIIDEASFIAVVLITERIHVFSKIRQISY